MHPAIDAYTYPVTFTNRRQRTEAWENELTRFQNWGRGGNRMNTADDYTRLCFNRFCGSRSRLRFIYCTAVGFFF